MNISREEGHKLLDDIFDAKELEIQAQARDEKPDDRTSPPEPTLEDHLAAAEAGEAPTSRAIPTDGRVVRTTTSGDRVYYLSETKKTRQWVTNPDVLDSLGFIMEDVTEVDDDEMLKYQMGPALYKRVDAQ